jgi:sarcosine oxidase subunit beta
MKIWEGLSSELEYNLLFSQQGHVTLAHSDSALTSLRVRAEANRALGVDTAMVDVDDIK